MRDRDCDNRNNCGHCGSHNGCNCRGPQGPRGERGERGEHGERGNGGRRGERGEQGERGERGSRGERGERGPAGENSGGIIIPFASGSSSPILISTLAGGDRDIVSLVSFGDRYYNSFPNDPLIDTAFGGNEAFVMPRHGTIKSYYASFFTDTLFPTTGSYTIHSEIYRATKNSLTFSPLAGTLVTLSPAAVPPEPLYNFFTGNASGLDICLNAGDRITAVVFMTGSSGTIAFNKTGTFSAGLDVK